MMRSSKDFVHSLADIPVVFYDLWVGDVKNCDAEKTNSENGGEP